MINRKWIRYCLLGLAAIAGIVLGYMRWTYVIVWDKGIKLVIRYTLSEKYQYPHNWDTLVESIIKDPRWLSLIFYSLAPFLLSVFAVYLTFLKKEYVKNTFVVYGIAWGVVIMFSAISIVYPTYIAGIGLAQNIKNLLQMPFFTLLLLAGFKVNDIVSQEK